MKVKLAVSIYLISFTQITSAQNPELWGMTWFGGINNMGVLFEINGDGSGFQTEHLFTAATGNNPYGSLVQASDGLLYATTYAGGVNNWGTIFSYNPNNQIYTKLYDFNYTQGQYPQGGSLVQTDSTKLFGMTALGGLHSYGVLYSYDILSHTYTDLYDFSTPNGIYPNSSLIKSSSGKLYGLTARGGINNNGVLFSFNPVSNTYTKLFELDNAGCAFPQGNLVEASNGKLYGTTGDGGIYDNGTIFCFDTTTNIVTTVFDFNFTLGDFPDCTLIEDSNMNLYGTTEGGGSFNEGVIFRYNYSTDVYTKLYDFNSSNNNGTSPREGLFKGSDQKLYGMTWDGGSYNEGVIFQFDLPSLSYSKILDFDSTNGKNPKGYLIELSTPAIIPETHSEFLSLTPNPTKGMLTISKQLAIKEISLFNLLGEKVFATIPFQNEIDISFLPPGIYILRASNGEKIFRGEVVKD